MSVYWIELALLLLAAWATPSKVKSESWIVFAIAYSLPAILALSAVAIWIVDRCAS